MFTQVRMPPTGGGAQPRTLRGESIVVLAAVIRGRAEKGAFIVVDVFVVSMLMVVLLG